jgi:ABC-type nitrate/sulfonate/bicarbonate transport system substrate-binding protein
VGSSGLGLSASRLALLVGLRRFGIDADKGQATIVAAGQEPERIAGLSTGAIAATVISPEYRTKLEQLGVNMLADLRTLNIPWETSSVITTVKNAQTKRDMLERVVRAILQAHAFILTPANRARVIELTNTQLALKSQQDAASVYDDLIKFYVFKKPYPTRDGFANVISEVAKQLPKAATLKYEDVVDNSIIEKLDKSGFIDALYK